MKTFRELAVWQQAHHLVMAIYGLTQAFPSEERYGLVSQMRRASVSVAANIVEGHRRSGRREFLQFLEVADASLEELKYFLLLANDLRYGTHSATAQIETQTEAVGRMLHALKSHVRREVRHVTANV